ncbi:MAG: Transcriptional regulator protein [Enterovirga sp.]|jgi:transcriptional regulator with XRE-family HTH domain|nr:Transcriptional regulator protein [Enterovirga sp.]
MSAAAMRKRAAPAAPESVGQEAGASAGIGRHLRTTRLLRGLRLKDLAEAAGCSEGLLSRIENDKTDPSLKLLQRLCAALGMTVGDLVSWAEQPDTVVVRQADRVARHFRHEGGPGTTIERLSLSGQLLMGYINTVAPGGSTGELISHVGEELGYVLSGELELVVGGVVHSIAAGDSFCFRSDAPHGYRNRSDAEARVIIVNAPPSF